MHPTILYEDLHRFHSETGNTRHVARHISRKCGDKCLIWVRNETGYSRFTKYLAQCRKSRGEGTTQISPAAIDVATVDTLVFGSPVWAFKPSPVIHAAICALEGYYGQPAIGFFTMGECRVQRRQHSRNGAKSAGSR